MEFTTQLFWLNFHRKTNLSTGFQQVDLWHTLNEDCWFQTSLINTRNLDHCLIVLSSEINLKSDTMAQLPNEMILMILNKLDDLNALLECRLVCRRWNALVKLIRIQTLQVGERYPANCVQMNQFSIDSDPALFNTNRVNFMKSNLMKTILSRLKQVCFCVVRITRHPEWSSFQKSLQQLR